MYRLKDEIAELEAVAREKIDGDEHIKAVIGAGFVVAEVAAMQCLLDLAIKGVIPDGRGGRIIEQVRNAIRESKERLIA